MTKPRHILTKIHFCLLLILSLFTLNASGQYQVEGRIVDSDTKEPLPFVNIMIEGTSHGTLTNIDGIFEIRYEEPIEKLLLSYVGYKPKEYLLPDSVGFNKIELVQKPVSLEEVLIYPGENPAHRIINNAIKNRDINNPENLNSFSYNAYNKFVWTMDVEQRTIGYLDSENFIKEEKNQHNYNDEKHPADSNEHDTMRDRLIEHLDSHHLFLSENYTERKFLQPGRNNNNILASRISGFKDPTLFLIADQMQSFSFYEDYIEIYFQKYLSPLAPNSTNRYLFNLEDTLYSANDSIYVISYRPGKGRNFEGLKGYLYIHTHNWAIQNVIAEPAIKNDNIKIQIRQKYRLIDDKQWFPEELHTYIEMPIELFPGETYNVIGDGRKYIENVKLDPEITRRDFNSYEYYWEGSTSRDDEDFWLKHRRDSLTNREANTYQFMDSIGEQDNLDRYTDGMLTLLDGRVPWKIFDFDIYRVINYNRYEGLRLGIPLQTNHRLSRHFTLKGHAAYGFKDKAFKYGFGGEVLLHHRTNFRIGFDHHNDINPRGISNFYHPFGSLLEVTTNPNIYQTMSAGKVDKSYKNQAWLSFLTLRNNLNLKMSLIDEKLTTTDDYLFDNNTEDFENQQYRFTETSLKTRFTLGESYIYTPSRITGAFSARNVRPVIYLNITKGWDDLLDGEFDYWKAEMLFRYHYNIRMLGTQSWSLMGGFIDSDLPWSRLFSARGVYSSMPLAYSESFITMPGQSMVSDRYAAVFFNHNFGSLLLRTNRISPEFAIFAKGIYGEMSNPGIHRNVDFNIPEKGYYEAGISIGNIPFLTENSNITISIAYNLGHYASPKFFENFAFGYSLVIEN